jgi:hypothetical protein
MRRVLFFSIASCSLILFSSLTGYAQDESGITKRLPIYVRVFVEVFKPTPIYNGEDKQKTPLEPKVQPEPKVRPEPTSNERNCTRGGRRRSDN